MHFAGAPVMIWHAEAAVALGLTPEALRAQGAPRVLHPEEVQVCAAQLGIAADVARERLLAWAAHRAPHAVAAWQERLA